MRVGRYAKRQHMNNDQKRINYCPLTSEIGEEVLDRCYNCVHYCESRRICRYEK